jgi:pimeloyl-ACP methyl ester carboxylesterase
MPGSPTPACLIRQFGLAIAAALMLAQPAAADSPGLVTESYHIPSTDAGIELYVRNKHPAEVATYTADRVLLYVHGATYPAETAFDLPLDQVSMMDYIAWQGFDVWLVDVRGYGGSTRPPAMEQPPENNPPFADTEDAARDVGSAVEHILAKRHIDKLNLMGWSWGTAIMGLYTTQHNDKVRRLVLYAPLWLFNTKPLIGGEGSLGAYRTASKASARQRWLKGVAPDKQADLIPDNWFDQWADATWATDPESDKEGLLRAPNGVIADVRAYWQAGKPQYDPADIHVPTLIVHAEWDADLPSDQAQAYFAKLTNAPFKRFVEFGEGTHTIIMEKNRLQLFREVGLFLNEPDPTELR